MLELPAGGLDGIGSDDGGESCEEWLEREDSVVYSRDFEKHPVYVTGAEQVPFSFLLLHCLCVSLPFNLL